jgi:hypothetical protein
METNPESHPEELLDRAISGRLASGDKQTLDLHLSACRVCATHLILARSAREVSAPQPWDDLLNRRAVERALTSVQRGSTAFSVPFRRRWALITAGVLVGLGGVAGATWWYRQGPGADALRAHEIATAAQPAARLHSAVAAIPELPPSPAPAGPDDRAAPHRGGRTPPSASSLFEEASALRDQDRPDQAVAVFRRLQQLYPRARETRMSYALAGHLLLDRGRPAQALAQFDQHLAEGGEASEEALVGRATALGRMGRYSAESETWRRLLDAYPKTVYAIRAEDRLSELARSLGVPAELERFRSTDGIGREPSEVRR